jgi:hypothetical protein
MLATLRLPPGPAVSGQALAPDALVREASWFILRGCGVEDAVIAAHLGAGAELSATGD